MLRAATSAGLDLVRQRRVFSIAIAVQLAAIGSSDGTVSGRMRFLSLHKLERPDVGRAGDKLCSLGNDWLRGMQVSAVDPIF
jgi:hypothetical protein